MRRIFLHNFKPIFFLVLFLSFIHTQKAYSEQFLPDLPNNQTWELKFEDEFDGLEVNTNYWNFDEGPRKKGYWSKDGVSIRDGNLVLTLYFDKSTNRHISGAINSQGKKQFLYGYFETRVKFQKYTGHWSAFWMMGTAPSPQTFQEFDIYESPYLTSLIQHAFHHYNLNGKAQVGGPQKFVHVKNFRKTYQTIGMWWLPGELRFYVNGKLTWIKSIKDEYASPMYLLFTDEIAKWLHPIISKDKTDETLIDYVRVFQLRDK